MEAQALRQKLFSQVTRPRAWHRDPRILVPQSLSPFSEKMLFGSKRRLRVLELGSGWGEFARAFLLANPQTDYVAFEIKADRILQTLKLIDKIPEAHFRILPINLNWFLDDFLPKKAFDQIIINFPDPWPKRRHWKHRLVQADFPTQVSSLLVPEGTIHIATDYGPYARKILRIFRQSPFFVSLHKNPDYRRERPPKLFSTKFERIQIAQGKRPYYMAWKKSHKKNK